MSATLCESWQRLGHFVLEKINFKPNVGRWCLKAMQITPKSFDGRNMFVCLVRATRRMPLPMLEVLGSLLFSLPVGNSIECKTISLNWQPHGSTPARFALPFSFPFLSVYESVFVLANSLVVLLQYPPFCPHSFIELRHQDPTQNRSE